MIMKQTLPIFFFVFLTPSLLINGAKTTRPTPPVDCTSALMGMMDCLDFIESGSTIAKPKTSCCSGLQQVVNENVVCLCQTFDLSKQMGIAIDVNKTLSLPSACHVKTPPFSECNINLPGVPARTPNTFTSSLSVAPAEAPSSILVAPVEAPSISSPSLPSAPTASSPVEDGSVQNGVLRIGSSFTLVTGFATTLLSYYYLIN